MSQDPTLQSETSTGETPTSSEMKFRIIRSSGEELVFESEEQIGDAIRYGTVQAHDRIAHANENFNETALPLSDWARPRTGLCVLYYPVWWAAKKGAFWGFLALCALSSPWLKSGERVKTIEGGNVPR
jgi:hypothetical protein